MLASDATLKGREDGTSIFDGLAPAQFGLGNYLNQIARECGDGQCGPYRYAHAGCLVLYRCSLEWSSSEVEISLIHTLWCE